MILFDWRFICSHLPRDPNADTFGTSVKYAHFGKTTSTVVLSLWVHILRSFLFVCWLNLYSYITHFGFGFDFGWELLSCHLRPGGIQVNAQIFWAIYWRDQGAQGKKNELFWTCGGDVRWAYHRRTIVAFLRVTVQVESGGDLWNLPRKVKPLVAILLGHFPSSQNASADERRRSGNWLTVMATRVHKCGDG